MEEEKRRGEESRLSKVLAEKSGRGSGLGKVEEGRGRRRKRRRRRTSKRGKM